MAAVLAAPVNARRTAFHSLSVGRVEAACDDGSALRVVLEVPPPLRPRFAFTPGKHVTLRAVIDGVEVRRCYSISSSPRDLAERGELQIGVRILPDGRFSSWVAGTVTAGAQVDVLPPAGSFTTTPDPARRGRYAAIVAGSGITPGLSLISTVLAEEPHSTFALLYGNRTAASAMFAEDLHELKDRYPDRFTATHLFSREEVSIGLGGRRWDAETLREVFARSLPPAAMDVWFVCGPNAMVDQVRAVLAAQGVPESAIRIELFHATRIPGPATPPPAEGADGGRLTVVLDGRATTVPVRPGRSLLQCALPARPELPFSCTDGVCGTCRARVVTGSVRMPEVWALTSDERAAGFVLTCQAAPESADLTVDFDA